MLVTLNVTIFTDRRKLDEMNPSDYFRKGISPFAQGFEHHELVFDDGEPVENKKASNLGRRRANN